METIHSNTKKLNGMLTGSRDWDNTFDNKNKMHY